MVFLPRLSGGAATRLPKTNGGERRNSGRRKVPVATGYPKGIEEALRRKGFFSMSPEERLQKAVHVLSELRESFPGDAQAALDAVTSCPTEEDDRTD